MMHKKTFWLTLCLLWLSALAAMGSPRAIYVTTSDLNMRMQPSPNAYKRGVAPRGTELLVVEWGDDWSKVIFEGDKTSPWLPPSPRSGAARSRCSP